MMIQCGVECDPTFFDVLSNPFASISLQNRADKKRLNIIIVAEGAIDSHNKAITPDYIKDVSMEETPGQLFSSCYISPTVC